MPAARAVAVVLAVASALTSCGGTQVPRPSPPSTPSATPASSSPTPTPPETASPTPTLEPSLQLPNDAPTTFIDPLSADALPKEALVPPGAVVTASQRQDAGDGGPAAVAVVWVRGEDAFAAERGLVVWQRFDDAPAWRAVYAFTDPPARGVLGIRMEVGDVTGDELDDLLTFEDIGGSGGCGTWRAVASGEGAAAEVWRHRACDTQVRISRGGIEMREAVFEPGDAHCCPSAYRISRLTWNGETLAEVRSTLAPAADGG